MPLVSFSLESDAQKHSKGRGEKKNQHQTHVHVVLLLVCASAVVLDHSLISRLAGACFCLRGT